jgi:NAD(P)-dependent dehydrogenase (short-subunit alcohol dehydrogenase family)
MGDRLRSQVAVVTGAGRGIGRAIALSFAHEGAAVCVGDKDLEAAEDTVREITGSGGESISVKMDSSKPADAKGTVIRTVETFGKLDILVNNAAIARYAPFLEYPLVDWVRSVEVNLTGCFLCAREAARQMAPKRKGKIINVSSISGCLALPNSVAYSSTKGGVDAFTRVIAYELADYGICVNAIAPGPIMTEMARKTLREEDRIAREGMIPLGRYGEVGDIVGAAIFLASKEADYITGQILYVDGGFSISGLPRKIESGHQL